MDPSDSEKPILVYDGDCSFCRLWIDRWRALTGDRVRYAPFQEVGGQFPGIPREAFVRSVQLILPGGEVFSAAHAVFRTLALTPGRAWMLWLYQHLPGATPVAEFFYGFVARHRNPLYRLTRLIWGTHFERPAFSLACWLFLRLMGAVYFFAFLSLATQILGLMGQNGILPAGEFLNMVNARVGSERYWFFPTLAWLSSSNTALQLMGVGGVLGSLLLVFDIAPILVLSLLWILYLSLVTVGQDFLAFQWDNLLLEAGFLAILMAPWHLWPCRSPKASPPRVARWLLWFLLFRLMFSSGMVKLTSGDPTWRNLTALEYHYYTQPLPTPIAWYAHLAPGWFQHGSAAFMFFVELAVPFLIFAPRLWRFLGGGVLIFLQLLIALTGNYAFFNLLTLALCLLLFDDAFLARFFPRALAERLGDAKPSPRRFSLRRWVTAPFALIIFAAGLLQFADLLSVQWLPPSAFQMLSDLQPVRISNSYGLFAVMTTSRPEIVIEGSNDGETWLDYEFKFKAGDLRRAPRWVEPFQPRLDWQMWFAALGDYRSSPWFSHLMLRLLEGSPPVLALLERNPFPQSPPRYVRALIYDYQFTTWPERRSQGEWWRRRLLGDFFPMVALKRSQEGEAPWKPTSTVCLRFNDLNRYNQRQGFGRVMINIFRNSGIKGALLASLFSVSIAGWGSDPASGPVLFNRDIRPILSDVCYACHGPDKGNRKTAMHFDTEEGALTPLASGGLAFAKGDLSKSMMYQRITSDDEAIRMPPAYLGYAKLPAGEIDLIKRWIEQGAQWQKHWSLIPPQAAPQPQVMHQQWPRDAIDYYVLARLEHEGLAPSPEADRATLIRRLTLDFTGLPPTPAEVEAFLQDPSPNAYEKVVDRLLNSPRYGENLAWQWLDAARYSDTNGYQSDGVRSMWRWRDWVIDAFNRNMPFSQFTIEQLAGDMLPNPTRDQVIATAFNRNHRTSAEGGIIDEEFRVAYVVDRVDTTANVWMGLTIGCARCHDHKYDPILQKEYYQLFAYFNNVPERGFVYNFGNEEPYVKAPTPEQEARLKEFDQRVTAAEAAYAALKPEIARSQRAWERWVKASHIPDWNVNEGLILHFPLDGNLRETTGVYERRNSFHHSPEGTPPPAKPDDPPQPMVAGNADASLPFVPGKVGQAASFDGKHFINAGRVLNFDYLDPFSFAAWINPVAPNGAILSSVEDVHEGSGYGLYLRDGKLRFNFTFRWTDLGTRLETQQPLTLDQWHHVALTYDGKRKPAGVKLYVDGVSQEINVLFDEMSWPLGGSQPFRIGAGEGPEDRFHGAIGDVLVYNRALSAEEAGVLPVLETAPQIAALPPAKRTPAQANKLAFCFLDEYAPQAVQEARRSVSVAQEARDQYFATIPTVMVMKEGPHRDAFILKRGAYDAHGDKVSAGLPHVLPPLPAGFPNNRLGFAQWLVDRSNPLTARVTVNRFWQMLFGAGLVKTVEDFGSQGDWPVYPDVLDDLATRFMDSGWNVKALLKTIVMSATYRQSSRVTPALLERDPENRLLARGPRFRLPAQVIRDQALAISGLLVETIGGPPVKPYQPPGLWEEVSFSGEPYKIDEGEGLYRRSLYTYWKRTVAPPAMVTFDAANRETCIVRANRTNTPLQALDLMNDVTYLEASRKFAERMMKEGGSTPEARIDYAFHVALARPPKPREQGVLVETFNQFHTRFQGKPEDAAHFLSEGKSPRDGKLNPVDLAAYTAVASLIFNMDEIITKE